MEAVNKSESVNTRSKSIPTISKKLNFKHFENDIDNDDLLSIIQAFHTLNLNVYNPYPVYHPVLNQHIHDLYFDLIKKKHEHNMEMEKVRTSYRKLRKKGKTCIDKFEHYERLQTILDKDPDKFFNSEYNWYYTGGNLNVENFANKTLLFHTVCGSKLYISELAKQDNNWIVLNKQLLATNTNDDNIYQLQTISEHDSLISFARNKSHIDIRKIKYDEWDDITSEIVKKHNSNIPFVNICINSFKNNEYATINTKQILKIWDMNSNHSKLKVEMCKDTFDKLDGNYFSQVNFINKDTCSYVNCFTFSLLDKRCTTTTTIIKEILSKDELFTNLCPNENSEGSNYIYLVTSLSVLQIDLRTYRIINRWDHCFKRKPFLSDCTVSENNLICIATDKPNEKLILGSKDDTSFYMPLSLPSLSESLDTSLTFQPQMNMSHIIRRRISLSTTGIKFVNKNKTPSIFAVNSIGDIFAYDIYKRTNVLEGKTNDCCFKNFCDWGDEILSNVDKSEPLYFVDRVFLKDLDTVLNIRIPPKDDMKLKMQKEQDLDRVKKQLQEKSEQFKTSLSIAWDLATSIQNIEEINPGENVEQWLNTLQNETNVDNEEYS